MQQETLLGFLLLFQEYNKNQYPFSDQELQRREIRTAACKVVGRGTLHFPEEWMSCKYA